MFTQQTKKISETMKNALFPVLMMLLITSCVGSRAFKSDYFEFASEKENLSEKAAIVMVPEYVDDDMIYYCRRGNYDGRQRVYYGVRGENLITQAFDTRSTRTIWEIDPPQDRYIAEIIVPEEDEVLLEQTFQETVSQNFGISGETVTLQTEVWIFKELGDAPLPFKTVDGRGMRYSYENGHISGRGINLRVIGISLETILKDRPILIELNDLARYNFDIKWEVDSFDNLLEVLHQNGLTLEPDTREVTFTRISPIAQSTVSENP